MTKILNFAYPYFLLLTSLSCFTIIKPIYPAMVTQELREFPSHAFGLALPQDLPDVDPHLPLSHIFRKPIVIAQRRPLTIVSTSPGDRFSSATTKIEVCEIDWREKWQVREHQTG